MSCLICSHMMIYHHVLHSHVTYELSHMFSYVICRLTCFHMLYIRYTQEKRVRISYVIICYMLSHILSYVHEIYTGETCAYIRHAEENRVRIAYVVYCCPICYHMSYIRYAEEKRVRISYVIHRRNETWAYLICYM